MGFLKNTIHRKEDLGSALKEALYYCSVGAVDRGGLTATCLMRARDSLGVIMKERVLIRTWIADADMSEPDAQTDFSVGLGEQMYEHEAEADYTVISNSDGKVEMNIEVAENKTIYIMAEIDGRIYSDNVTLTA